ncbi:MAG: class I SAM-dependent methyltransferase [Prosthecobacter sp.]|nr:class I SAM-dependent methyltransferase [Prosthecobacter sp.]
MKTRESGMPPEEMWQTFFDPLVALVRLGLTSECACVVDFGCGYGTFSVPAATMVRGVVHALDIDAEMVSATKAKGEEMHLDNLKAAVRDFVAVGSGLEDGSADYVMLFNILHAAESDVLLKEARRVLRRGGKLGVMHWNHDPSTPRGPSMAIRPKPEQCMRMVEEAGFEMSPLIDFPPFHYGFVGIAR